MTVILLHELEHAIAHLGAKGPEILAEASDVAGEGVEALPVLP